MERYNLVLGAFDADERDEMRSVIDTVCDELGISPAERARRVAVARRVADAYRDGYRQPLNLVHAGLEAGV
jgi:hypothetical protein